MDKKVTRVSPAAPMDTIETMETPTHRKSLISLHYHEEAVDAENVGAAPVETMTYQQRWIRDNIKMRVCKKFVEKPIDVNSSDLLPPVRVQGKGLPGIQSEAEPICRCGYPRSTHGPSFSSGTSGMEDWKVDTHTRATRTNAFGTVEFLGFGENERNYVRVDVNTKMKDMMELMMDVWGLEKPNLLISVTGGAKNFTMKQKLKEEFRRGLMKVARSTGAWIITGGTNAGVMKHVGEAVRDYGLVSASTNPIIVIGVATWGCIQNKEDLTDSECRGKWPASYRLGKKQRPKESFLDPNHTHFVLVDNGTQHQFGVEIPFRARMENSIANMKTNTGKNASVYVPVVLLVLEGGPGTLETAHQAVANNTPIVIVQGSGRAADILAYAYQNSIGEEIGATDQEGKTKKITQTIFDASVEAEIRNQVEENFGKKNLVSHCEMVKETLKNRDLVTVFEFSIGGRGSSKDIDRAILQALLRANKDQIFDQLKLALAWNRIDIAKSEIFTDDRFIQPSMLFEIMQSALILNRVTFVELLMDNGVNLKDFLTKKRLLKLYNHINKNTQLYQLLDKIRRKNGNEKYISMVDVGCLIQDLIGDFYTPWYLLDPKVRDLDVEYLLDGVSAKCMGMPGIKRGILSMATGQKQESVENELLTSDEYQIPDFDNPFQELFLWAVLLNRQEMAKILWKGGKDATAAALVASGMLNSLSRQTDDTELAKKLKENSQEFSNLAIAVLNECYDVEEKKAQNLLIRELEHWGAATCVLLAVESNNKKFISQTACQTLLNNVWMGHLSLDNQMLQLLLCVFIPPLIFPVIKFKDDNDLDGLENLEEKGVLREKKRKLEKQKTLSSLPVKEEKEDLQVDYESKPSNLSFWKKLYYFYTAPVIIFAHNVLSYVIFLGLYSYILLVKFDTAVSNEEIILIIWVFSIFAEEVRQLLSQYSIYERITIYRTSTNQNASHIINPSASNNTQSFRGKNHSFHPSQKMLSSSTKNFNTKLHSYITDPWNIVDVATIFIFVMGIVLRFLPFTSTLEAARCVMALNLVIFFFRILHIFSVHKQLGPKLVMIGRMLKDLLYFIIILMVFVVSYSIAAYSVMYPNSELSIVLVYNVMRLGYWNLYGELFLEDIEKEEPGCTFDSNLYSNGSLPRCPSAVSRYAVPILMGFYVLFCNILLLNLLIAMFSNTYQIVQENTDQYWCFQRYRLIYEYYTRPTLAPPLILISHMALFIRWIFGKCSFCLSSQPSDLIKRFSSDKARELVQWENMIADAFMNRLELEEKKNIENRVINTQESIHELFFKLDELQDLQTTSGSSGQAPISKTPINQVVRMPPQMDKRLLALEEQMQQSTVALNWIMKILQEQEKNTRVAPMLEDKKENVLADRQEPGKKSFCAEALTVAICRTREKQKKEKDKALVKNTVEERKRLNYKARLPRYPQSLINRFPVPDHKVSWEIPFPEYDPVVYEAPEVKEHPYWADTIDLIFMKPEERIGKIKFNEYDDLNKVNRKSYVGTYQVHDGLPLNPAGRTGLIGRGLLGRYGPNHCGDPIVTRWKRDDKGNVVMKEGKKVLEFVAIFRKDNELWSIPGGMCEPGQKVSQCLKAEFTEEALGSLIEDSNMEKKIKSDLKIMMEEGEEIYKGICDDPRNTDNSWLETVVFNYHDDTGKVLHPFLLRAGETVEAASWLEVSSSLILHSSHLYYVQLVAEKLNAYF